MKNKKIKDGTSLEDIINVVSNFEEYRRGDFKCQQIELDEKKHKLVLACKVYIRNHNKLVDDWSGIKDLLSDELSDDEFTINFASYIENKLKQKKLAMN